MRWQERLCFAAPTLGLLVVLGASLGAATAAVGAAGAPAGQIVYARRSGGSISLHLMQADGTGDRLLSGQPAGFNAFPTWSPDGKQIAFITGPAENGPQHSVALLGAEGTDLALLQAPSGRSGLAAWSPDGRRFTFTSGEERPNVYVSDTAGNGARQVNPPDTGGAASAWLADGKRLVYTRFGAGEMARLVIAQADGSGEENLSAAERLVLAGPNAGSPDGRRLAYVVLPEDRKASLRIWDFATRTESFLIEFAVSSDSFMNLPFPAWSPDGRWILVPMHTDKGTGLFRVSDDGKMQHRLTPEGVDCLSGAWMQKK